MRKSILYRDYSDDTERIAKLSLWFPEGIEFEVELGRYKYNCTLYKDNKWYVRLNDYDFSIELASLNDTYWNARKIWYELENMDISCAISGAINEIYQNMNGLL